MGGSFESGAGDDPDDLFAGGSEDEETRQDEADETGEDERERSAPPAEDEADETAEIEAGAGTDRDRAGDRTRGESDGPDEPAPDEDGVLGDAPADEGDDEPVMLALDGRTDVDAARLAREFVPEDYDKPHAWALGRDGVNDGRTEKKTFFLQERVVELEAECQAAVGERLGGDVPVTDLRELALVLAYHQPELLAEAAREWGAESA